MLLKDEQGSCSVFFQYSEHLMVDMAREMIAVTMGRKTVADVCELLRKGIVNAARDGKTCVINVDKLAPDFTSKYTGDAENFPAATIFNKAEWEKKENYIKIVRESENCSVAGQNPGHYVMQPGFNIIILSASPDEEKVAALLATIPHIDQFKKYTITA